MVEVDSDDIFLVSYPKSGNTWLRFLIGNYLTENQCDFTNSHLLIPDIHYNPEQINQVQKPRFIKSHHPFTPDYHRVVYITRDGRDVAVSYYFYALKFKIIDNTTTFSDFVLNILGKNIIDSFTPWSHHIFSWLDRATTNFLFVKYEDVKADTVRELKRILEFSGLPIDEDRLLGAVEASSFKNMQQLELSQSNLFERFKNSDASIKFVREGSTGTWRNFFSDELLAYFIETHGLALERLGYLSAGVTKGFQVTKQQFVQLTDRYKQSQAELDIFQNKTSFLTTELSRTQLEYQHLYACLECTSSRYQVLQAELEQMQGRLKQTEIHQQQLQAQLTRAQARSQKLQAKLSQVRERSQKRQQDLKAQLDQAQATLKAMESSKFWKLRNYWFSLKRWLHLVEKE